MKTLLRLWQPIQPVIALIICLLALIVIARLDLTQRWQGEIVMGMKVAMWVWAVFWMLEIYQEWKRESKPMRSTVGEIYGGYRNGDPAFKRSTSSDRLSLLAMVLSLVALYRS